MSSILDALKKLEEEKAKKRAANHAASMHSEEAERALVAQPWDGGLFGLSPLILGVAGAVVVLVIAGVAAITAVAVTSRATQTASAPASEPAAEAVSTAAAVEETAQPPTAVADGPGAESDLAQEPVANAQTVPAAPSKPKPSPRPSTTARDQAAPTPDRLIPAVAAAPEANAAPERSETGSAVYRAPLPPPVEPELEASTAPLPENLKDLPRMRAAERARMGLENIRINMLREASETRPYGLAVINLDKVYVGDLIPRTQVKLLEVEPRGIAIENLADGKRYYIEY